MEPARAELEQAIDETNFSKGICAIYQNVTAIAVTNPVDIKKNLKQMITDGLTSVTEVGPGKVLQGLFKKTDKNLKTQSATL